MPSQQAREEHFCAQKRLPRLRFLSPVKRRLSLMPQTAKVDFPGFSRLQRSAPSGARGGAFHAIVPSRHSRLRGSARARVFFFLAFFALAVAPREDALGLLQKRRKQRLHRFLFVFWAVGQFFVAHVFHIFRERISIFSGSQNRAQTHFSAFADGRAFHGLQPKLALHVFAIGALFSVCGAFGRVLGRPHGRVCVRWRVVRAHDALSFA